MFYEENFIKNKLLLIGYIYLQIFGVNLYKFML